ncbi:MFS transporter [Mycolicibacterium sp. P1-5]|uniref:MFS transporter n=1 Tax=Mycolicibacterium sp. P1-5 TaxID=2024617 RepID=UPI001D139D2B|nr:MFS transporter [Mycolicibacterium sp. P1-5]
MVISTVQRPTHARHARQGQGMRGNPWWILAAVSVGVIMVGLDASVVAIANPRIAADLNASLSDLQWITDAYLLSLASLLIFGGKLGDMFGRRLVFLIGVVGFAATSVGIGIIGTVSGVIAMRALQGVFGALLMPSTLAIVRKAFPAHKLNMAIGIWGAASGVSVAAGPILGGVLVEHLSWESVFYINVPIAVVAVLIGVAAIVESRSDDQGRLDVAGILTLSGSLFLLVYGLIKAPEWGWLDPQTVAFLIGGIVLMGAFVIVERNTNDPMLPLRLFANPSLSIGAAATTINFFALFGALFFMTLYLQNVQGWSPVETGVRTLPLSAAMMLMAPLSGVMTERFGPRPAMVTGLAGVAGGLALLSRLTVDSGYGAIWPAFALLGLGVGLVLTASSDAIVGNAPVDDAGVAGGLQSTSVQLGAVLGTTILGSVLSSKVGSTLVDKLTAAGTPAPIAEKLSPAKELVAKGMAPSIPGAPPQLTAVITGGSHEAFMAGLQVSMWVGAAAATVGAVLALFVRRGET